MTDQKTAQLGASINDQEHLKQRQKRASSIMQIEKHIENKIVKGWNQMINDFTPKPNNAASAVESTMDGSS